jgi:cytochrome c peroxidase
LLFGMGLLGIFLAQLLRVSAVAVLPEGPAILPIEAIAFDQPISPLPLILALDHRKVELGRRLFNDPRLSRDDRFSCTSCHDLKMGGADGLPQSIELNGQPLTMNAPTILNSAYNFRQFWNGRALTLEDQVNHPLVRQMK